MAQAQAQAQAVVRGGGGSGSGGSGSSSGSDREAARSLARLLPRLEARYVGTLAAEDWHAFHERLTAHFEQLFVALRRLYGERYDFFWHLERALDLAAESWIARPAELRALDARREAQPGWFSAQTMMGAVCYVDRFAGTLAGLRAKLPYLRELGVSYLHLMPLFRCPEGNNDGGYAVSSYREVDPALGTMAELAELCGELRAQGISPVIDFIFNHTSDEHDWALRAIAGDAEYQDYYLLFPDRTLPDAYERTLREIFPEERPGSFSWREDLGRWVWTTFHSFQWDLNYANPEVFRAMAGEMLFLANQGVEVLRFDAVVFIWKQMGTTSENLPEVHDVIRAFNALARIAAPALLFKSEAIVHPDDIATFISPEECQLSYNPLLMALLWESLATRSARLLRESLAHRFRIDPRCAWVNYVRSHDDIGWTFDDEDARRVGIDPAGHRRFLNAFYTGRFPDSFARGLPFQENPRTGDARISGTCASLAGLEAAIHDDPAAVELAVRRVLLLYGVVIAIGGIPLLYLGDELGTLNDYGYRADPDRASDSRWVHRPLFDWDAAARRTDDGTLAGRVFCGIQRMIALRQAHAVFSGVEAQVVDPGNDAVFAMRHSGPAGGSVLILANVTEFEQPVAANVLRLHGLAYRFRDLLSDEPVTLSRDLLLAPYRIVWLVAEEASSVASPDRPSVAR